MQLPIEELSQAPVTDVVSLGPQCATAHNLRRYFDFSTAYPFDWWVTAGAAITTLLTDLDVEKIYDAANLQVIEGRHSVSHRQSGALLHHEFPRGSAYPDGRSGPIAENYLDALPDRKSRAQHIFGRFAKLDDTASRILFVRQGVPIEGLEAALEKRFPLASWGILYVPILADDPDLGWKQSPVAWDALLASTRAKLVRSRHEAFHEGAGLPVAGLEHAIKTSEPAEHR